MGMASWVAWRGGLARRSRRRRAEPAFSQCRGELPAAGEAGVRLLCHRPAHDAVDRPGQVRATGAQQRR